MKLLRTTWHAGLWCTRKGCLMILWSAWLLMTFTAALQAYFIRTQELTLPGPVRRLIERQLAEKGLQVSFAKSTVDFTGQILLENVALGTGANPTPLLTARSVYLKLDPIDLLIRRVDVTRVSASGVDLHLPAMLSPSGQDETLVHDADFTVHPRAELLWIDHFTGRIAGLAVSASGAVNLPPAPKTTASPETVDAIVAAYLRTGRLASAWVARLDALEEPALDLEFLPTDDRVATVRATLRAGGLNFSSVPALKGASAGALVVNAEMPVGGRASALLRGSGRIATLTMPGQGSLQDVCFSLVGLRPATGPVSPKWLDLQFGSARFKDFPETGPAEIKLTPLPDDWVAAEVVAGLAGSPWRATARLDPKQGRGRVEINGRIDAAMLGLAGVFAKRDLAALLDPAVPAHLHAAATFLPGWKLEHAEGRLHSGPVKVAGVALDETGAEFSYRDGRVVCDNLVLRQGASLAHGLYEMDAATLDFRFLLKGSLNPAGISPWFHDWWTRFWGDFDFSASLPVADVDVGGRWGNLTATRVFVQAAGGATGLRGVPFDRVETRLFIRPQWEDILAFHVVQNGREAAGSFNRLADLEKNAWSRMTFSVDSGLPLDTIRGIFGKDGAEWLAPYKLANAPKLKVSGHVESPVAPGGAHQTIDIALQSVGEGSFHDFPAADLEFDARMRDTALDLPKLDLSLAHGHAVGSAKIRGEGRDRRVSVDATLTNANLGEAIRLANLKPAAAAAKPAAAKPGEKALSERLVNGRLNLSLKAEGLLNDFYSFTGGGQTDITGANLGEINLFGLLSALLKKTVILDFTSFSLDRLNARFTIKGPGLAFDNLKLAGPSASIDAKGVYDLKSHQFDFKARIFPFDESKNIVGNTVGFVLSPLSNALEVKLDGTMEKPRWVFLYGPSSFLQTIFGGGSPAPLP